MSVLNGSEAFAAWLPFWGVPFSYAVAVSYVLVDTADKGVKAYQLARLELGANASLHPEVDTPRCVLSLHKAANPPDADLLGLLLASCCADCLSLQGYWWEDMPCLLPSYPMS